MSIALCLSVETKASLFLSDPCPFLPHLPAGAWPVLRYQPLSTEHPVCQAHCKCSRQVIFLVLAAAMARGPYSLFQGKLKHGACSLAQGAGCLPPGSWHYPLRMPPAVPLLPLQRGLHCGWRTGRGRVSILWSPGDSPEVRSGKVNPALDRTSLSCPLGLVVAECVGGWGSRAGSFIK